MIQTSQKRLLTIVLIVLFVIPFRSAYGTGQTSEHDSHREKLLSYIIQKKLTSLHYSHKKIDNSLSENAFKLYIKQLDFQKRFLLQEDFKRLKAYASSIDDEILDGKFELPALGATILKKRVTQVQEMVRTLLKNELGLSGQGQLETDPEKLDYCENDNELKERWQKIITLQIISRYLNLLEDEELSLDLNPDQGRNEITPNTEEKKTPKEILSEAKKKVLKSYETLFARMLNESNQDHYNRYLNAFARAYDPHTNYLPPDKKEDFDIHMRGSLEGIGAMLREEDGYIKVVRIIPGSAASRQGQLQAEDIILEVAEGDSEPVDITDTRIRDAVALIRGKKGSEVRLTVKKADGSRLIIPIIRDVVQIEETFVKATYLRDESNGKTYGYLKIPSFYRDFNNGKSGRNATDDVQKKLKEFSTSKTEGLVLDLRSNGGGALEDAVSIAGLFIKTGPVVQVKDNDGDIEILTDEDPKIQYKGPLVVLVNKFSASASEILAAALQDYGRAIIIGSDHTHGKGTVQTLIDLNRRLPFQNMAKYRPLGALKVTTQKFYRVSGESTQYKGVTPDIILPDRINFIESGEQYADFSLPWDTVQPTFYPKRDNWETSIESLKSMSLKRIQEDEAFIGISEEADKAAERSKKTRQSLNIDDIRQEFKEERQRKKLAAKNGLGHFDKDEEKTDSEITDEERKKLWIKEVNEDPYVKEAIAILHDVLKKDLT